MKTLVRQHNAKNIKDLLIENSYLVEEQEEGFLWITLSDYDAQIAVVEQEQSIFFQMDIIGINELKEEVELYKTLLDLNTEILPISLAIDSTNEENKRLILTESLETENLDENELLKIVETFELSLPAVFKVIKENLK
jgi:hypothetical protein